MNNKLSRRHNNLYKDENAYRKGLRRRITDKVETQAFYLLLSIIIIIYALFIIGAFLGWGEV